MTDDYVHHDSQMKSENEKLQKELEQHKLREREWEQKLKEVEDRLRLETDLRRREKELESKEGGMPKKEQEIQTTGEEHHLHSNVELTSPGCKYCYVKKYLNVVGLPLALLMTQLQ